MTIAGAGKPGSTAWHVPALGLPHAPLMGAWPSQALPANLASVALLSACKDGDANVRSVWLCSRNDAMGNLAVIAAAGLAGLFLNSAWQILRHAAHEFRDARARATPGE